MGVKKYLNEKQIVQKIHKNIDHKCPDYDYSSKDICYLKHHRWVHSAEFKYN